jgi:hypothetical protein
LKGKIISSPLKKIHVLFWVIGFSCLFTSSAIGQNITPASGGQNISADDANGPFTSLGNIIIDETSTGQISQGQLVFNVPADFEWDVSANPSVTIEAATGYSGKGTSLDIQFSNITANKIIFDVIQASDQPPNKAGKATFTGLAVRPTTASLPNEGDITASGSSVPNVNANYGTLIMVAGAPSDVYVETAANGSGSEVTTQNLTAGNAITVYSISRDQGGNFINNVAADTWSLVNKNGLTASPLSVAADSKSATFSSTSTGSAAISATKSGLVSNTSGTINVIPDSPTTIQIQTQPSSSNTAGTAFATQPVLVILDQYGNTTTSNSFTSVTASRKAGTGTLKGTTTASASNGIVTFTDLYHTKANDISIDFTAPGLTGATSNTITINPASADSLAFTVQPPNGVKNTPLDPAPEVQLLDAYGNTVAVQDTTVTLVKVSGAGNINGTPSVLTNTNGIAVFNNIKITQNDTYVIKASSPGLTNSESSNPFTIANPGSLAGFKVEKSGGGNLGAQVAGVPFDIGIAAVDGVGDTLDGQMGRDTFSGFVTLATSSKFSNSIDTTHIGPFVNGVYDPSTPYSVELIQSGDNVTITATNDSGSESGSSNSFLVTTNNAFPDSTMLIVNRDSLIANGSDTTLVMIQLRDSLGNKLNSGGDGITINNSGTGSLSAVTDNGNGSYSAILTAPTNVGSATLTVDVNGNTVSNLSKTVNFFPGPLSTFRIEDAGGSSGSVSNQTAGVPFNVKITALDAYGNTVTSFDRTVEITSGATFNSGNGTTAPFTNGILSSQSIELTSAGDYKISARRTGFSETGESNVFTVSPGPADRTTSTITSDSPYLENNGTDNTTIRVQLKDAFGNKLTSQDGNNVYLFFAGSPSSTLSSNPTSYSGDGLFTGTLTAANNTTETVNVIGTLNNPTGSSASSDIDTVEVIITQFNTWQSSSGGNRSTLRDWSLSGNWSQGIIPGINQIINIPTTPLNASFYPIIAQNSTIDFLDIKDQATVNLESGYTLNLNQDLSGAGTFICDRATLNVSGDITVATLAASTCNVTLAGTGTGEISGRALTGSVVVDRDINVTGSLEAIDTLVVTSGHTLTIADGATLDVQGTFDIQGQLVFNGGHLSIGGDVNGTNINISNTTVEFDGTNAQNITGLGSFRNLIINNSQGVTFHNDVIVSDTLKLTDGTLTIDSGYSLVSTEKTGNLSNIRMLREISGTPGWRMIAPPLVSTYDDLLDNTVTQGYSNSLLGLQDANGDSLQPNVLYYDETREGTDNQRWRSPADATNALTPGRGLFVYFFGNVRGDNRYTNPLPDTLTLKGAENDGDGSSFTFPVTYTAAADTGWNLVGNPYAATIDWDDGNWTKQNMDNVIYVWDPSKNDYQEYNGIDGDPALDNGLIMPFQGFWVKANGNGAPLLKVSEASKTTGGEFFKKSTRQPASIEFMLEADSLEKTSHITLSPDGKNSKDRRDAFRLLPFDTQTYLELYFTLDDGTELSIDNLARSFGREITIPIHVGGFKKGQPINGDYTISWPKFGDVPDAWTMILEDKKTGDKIDVRKNAFYSFNLTQSKQKKVINNTPQNFHLVERPSKKKSADSSEPRFLLHIDPGADAAGLPDKYSLGINYPNPFDEQTTIKYATPIEGKVQIFIYDILGRKIKTILDKRVPADFHEITWNPTQLASGIYICVMRAGGKQFTRKLTYIK